MFTPAVMATVVPTFTTCPAFNCKSLYAVTALCEVVVFPAVTAVKPISSNNLKFAPLESLTKINTKVAAFVPATFAPICVIFVPFVAAVKSVTVFVIVAPVLSVVAPVTVANESSGDSANMGDVFAAILVVIK
jgi:hypothetical protein